MAQDRALTRFVDTNIFLRVLIPDDARKLERCLALFEAAERGDAALTTSESVIAEIVYVLRSPAVYGLARSDLAARVRPLLQVRGLHIDHRPAILAALDLYEQSNLSFEDCLSVQHVLRQGLEGIYSYDRGFRPALGIRRFEP